MGEIKQTNFRIDANKADAFRKFCEGEGYNQAQGFDHLIQLLELEQAKAIIPERLTEIETFEQHIKAVQASFLQSLEVAKNTEERVLEKFKGQLESQSKLIAKLQKENQEKAEIAKIAEKKMQEMQERLKIVEERAEARTKYTTNQQEQIIFLEKQLKKFDGLESDFEDLKKVCESQKQELAELNVKLKDSSIELERAVTASKAEMSESVNKLKLDLAIADTKIAEKEANLEKADKKIDALEKEIADLRAKNVELTLKLEQKN